MDKEYHITLNGKLIPVTEEVYYAFKRPAWRERCRLSSKIDPFFALNFDPPGIV